MTFVIRRGLIFIGLMICFFSIEQVQAVQSLASSVPHEKRGTFRKLSDELELGRSGHGIALLGQHRLFVGGGGWGDWGGESKAEVIDISSGKVQTIPSQMSLPRSNSPLVTLKSGHFMLIGGASDFELSLRSTEVFDPSTESFAQGPELKMDRNGHSATVLEDGRVVVIGGENESYFHSSIEIYDPKKGEFTLTHIRLSAARARHTATLLNKRYIVIAGGETGPSKENPSDEPRFLNSIEVLDTLHWTLSSMPASMNSARIFHSAIPIHDRAVAFIGGLREVSQSTSEIDIFNLEERSVVQGGVLSVSRSLHSVVKLNSNEVLITGGVSNGEPQRTTERCTLGDKEIFSCKMDASMKIPRWMHESQILSDGRVLVVGGLTNTPEPGRKRAGPSHSVEIFSP